MSNIQEQAIEGRVICQFIVEKDGSIGNITVVRTSGNESLDNEAIRVIQSMPKWKPGLQRGKPVRVKYTLPINFRLVKDEAYEEYQKRKEIEQEKEEMINKHNNHRTDIHTLKRSPF